MLKDNGRDQLPMIRAAVAADQRAIRDLVHRTGINPFGIHWQRFIIVEDGGRIAGIGQVKVHRDGGRELASIAVAPECRNRGIAKQIIQTLLANERGAVYLTCRRDLESFYERFGFRRVDSPAGLPRYFRVVVVAFAVVARLSGRRPRVIVMAQPGQGTIR